MWTLPGKTKIVCHLKDKKKIRNKKRLFEERCEMDLRFLSRWSQIMYMYYLLGYKIMELPNSDERKEVKIGLEEKKVLKMPAQLEKYFNALKRIGQKYWVLL